ncbi:serine/threonine-protein kinase, partial [Hyalangium sp.]|uniref:serine/threonine protein kinase n=1 Tax=Hyalangium sp. TaxID=2028555 RepID=UPI002D2742AC
MKKSPSRHPGFLSPGAKVDGFHIQERLSSGGFGVVYLATRQGRSYALKFALRQASSGPHDRKLTDERMKRELGCLLRLHHPHIPNVFAHGRYPGLEDGYFYIAMEYVEGDTLRVWAARHRPTLRSALRLFLALADALDAAHQQGIFHRDLKPANILVRPTGVPVIVDWGAGDYALSAPLTQEHLPPGTPAYRSPESLRFARLHANDPGARYEFQPTDDLYSLGVTFYEVLTGQSLFFYGAAERARLDAEIELRIPTPPHEVLSAIPVPLSEVVMRLLSKDPRQRHATAEALKRDLASLDDESAAWEALLPASAGWEEPEAPAEAGPPRTARLSRRLWWAVALAACVGGMALAISTFSSSMRPAAPTPPPEQETAPTPMTAATHPMTPSTSPGPTLPPA